MQTNTTSLWDFALSFYAQPDVAQTCVKLQDTYGVNVCLLIALRWLDGRHANLSAAQLAEVENLIQAWYNNVVVTLRTLRQQLKHPLENIPFDDAQQNTRTAIKQAELCAEKKLLLMIEAWAVQTLFSADEKNARSMAGISTCTNVSNYLSALHVPNALQETITI